MCGILASSFFCDSSQQCGETGNITRQRVNGGRQDTNQGCHVYIPLRLQDALGVEKEKKEKKTKGKKENLDPVWKNPNDGSFQGQENILKVRRHFRYICVFLQWMFTAGQVHRFGPCLNDYWMKCNVIISRTFMVPRR